MRWHPPHDVTSIRDTGQARLTWQALEDEQLRHGAVVGQQRGQVQRRDAHRPLVVRRQHVAVPLGILDQRLYVAVAAVSSAVICGEANYAVNIRRGPHALG